MKKQQTKTYLKYFGVDFFFYFYWINKVREEDGFSDVVIIIIVILWHTWVLLHTACLLPLSTRGRQQPYIV